MSRPKMERMPIESVRGARGHRLFDEKHPRCMSLITSEVEADELDWLRYPINEVLLVALVVALHEGTTWDCYEESGRILAKRILRYAPFAAGAPSEDAYRRLLEGVDIDELKWLLTTITATNLYNNGDDDRVGATAAQDIVDEGVLDTEVTGAVRALVVWDASRCERLFVEIMGGEAEEARTVQAWLANACVDFEGAVVVADAPFACPETACAIACQGADYVLRLADGRGMVGKRLSDPSVLDEVRAAGVDYLCETRTGRREVEVRETYRLDPVAGGHTEWDALCSVVCQVTTTTATRRGAKSKVEVSYFLSSLARVTDIAEALGQHWAMVAGNNLLERAWDERDPEVCERNGLVSRALLEKLAKALGKIAQSDPYFEGTSVRFIRKRLGWGGEEAIAMLFETVGREGFVDAVKGLKVTAYDKRRYQEQLDEDEFDVFVWQP